MASSRENLILEVHHYPGRLRMSIGGRGHITETVRHYSQCSFNQREIRKTCAEIGGLLEESRPSGPPKPRPLLGDLKKNGLLLWDQLLTAPVKAFLKSSLSCELSLLLDEELVYIPWELVFDGHDFLSLKFSVGRLIGTSAQNPPQARIAGDILKMLVLADPTGDLRCAYDEGLGIRRRFDAARGRMSVDFRSRDLDSLAVKRSLREYDIVHFAGHCEYDAEDPSRSGWVLEDSRLTCMDILQMAGGLPLPSLIFSNSCHSARTAMEHPGAVYQERTYSLASAFLFSGVRHYLGTFHRIDDLSGQAFSAGFYSSLFTGMPIGEAVRKARQSLFETAGEDNLSWANYILYGDPGFVLSMPLPGKRPAGKSRIWIYVASVAAVSCLSLAAAWMAPRELISLERCRRLLKEGRNEEAARISAGLIDSRRCPPEAHLVMADALERLGRNAEAIQHCFDYLVKAGENRARRANEVCVRIGWLYQLTGDYSKALEFYQRALSDSRERADKYGESTALRRLAVWHMDKGDDNKALELLTMCLEIDRERQSEARYKYNLACDYFDMGLVFSNKDRMDTAKEFYLKSVNLFQQMRLTHEESDYYFNLGEICASEKQYGRALENYLKGLSIDKASGNINSLAGDYNMIGELYAEMERPDKAEEYYLLSLETARGIQVKPILASVCENLGMLKLKAGLVDQAKAYLREAFELYRLMEVPEAEEVEAELKRL